MDEHPTDHPFVESDDPPVDEDDVALGRRRWPIAVVSLLVVVVAIGATLYLAASHYQPLSQSLGGGYGSQVLSGNGTLATNRSAGGGNRIIWTEPSGTYRVEAIVTINNDQRFGVTIDKVFAPLNPSGNSDVRVYFDSSGTNVGTFGFKGGPAFHATTLASKGSLQLVVHWDQQCVPASSTGAMTYTTMPVQFTFLGFRHTVNVPIDPLTIRPRATC